MGRMDRETATNLELWNEWTGIHERSEFYDLEGFRAEGEVRIRPFEQAEVGDVAGKSLLHLQCHFGIDTLSWARLGATVTGADFSPEAVALARRLADELGIDARFVESSIEELPSNLEGQFDVVYTSRGVTCWLRDLHRWAEVAAHFVKPGGFFYIHEAHPTMWAFDDERDDTELVVKYPYFERDEPLFFPVVGSYADPTAKVQASRSYNWIHSLGEVVTVLVEAGLRIEWLKEHPFLDWPLPFLVEAPDRTWVLPPERGDAEIPLSFSLKATKPA